MQRDELLDLIRESVAILEDDSIDVDSKIEDALHTYAVLLEVL